LKTNSAERRKQRKEIRSRSSKRKEVRKLEKQLQDLKLNLDEKSEEIKKLEVQQNEKLQKISGLTSDEAKKMLLENMINQAKTDAAQTIKEIHDQAKIDAKKKHKNYCSGNPKNSR